MKRHTNNVDLDLVTVPKTPETIQEAVEMLRNLTHDPVAAQSLVARLIDEGDPVLQDYLKAHGLDQ